MKVSDRNMVDIMRDWLMACCCFCKAASSAARRFSAFLRSVSGTISVLCLSTARGGWRLRV